MAGILIWLGETVLGAILKAVFVRLFPAKAPVPCVTLKAAENLNKPLDPNKVADAIGKDGL